VIKLALGTRFKDAHCGFKTGRSDVVKKILPYIEDNEWFFDTEFFLGERLGHRSEIRDMGRVILTPKPRYLKMPMMIYAGFTD
jgi:hypothetical protein